MRYLLLDCAEGGPVFIADKLGDTGVIYSPASRKKIISWLKGAVRAVRMSHSGDTIISWFDFQGIMVWWLCRLLFRKRNIVCINLMLKDKDTLRNRIVSYMYRRALTSGNCRASVTSGEYGLWLNKKLRCDIPYALVRDVYGKSLEANDTTGGTPERTASVFCGGRNGRDWQFMLLLAAMMPDVEFCLVMSREDAGNLGALPGNVRVHTDVPFGRFMQLMRASSLVCLPLDTEAPAGLIVLFQATANDIPVMTTSTAATRGYVTADRGYALPADPRCWAGHIREVLSTPAQALEKAARLKNFLRENCSEDDFVDALRKTL